MYNKKALSEAISKLNAAKAPKQKPDILYTEEGQWKHPGEATRIPSDTITMDGVPYPVMAYPNIGEPIVMQPGGEYYFPEADYVDEYPMMKRGGSKGLTKGKTKSLTGLNKLLAKNPLLRSYKHKIFDPKHNKFQDGGFIDLELTNYEIEEYKKGGYIVEEYQEGSEIISEYGWDYKKDGENYFTRKTGNKDWIQAKGNALDAIKTKVYKEPSSVNLNSEKEIANDNLTSNLKKGFLPVLKEIPVEETCSEKGCSFNVSQKMGNLLGNISKGGAESLWAEDAWFNKSDVINKGGDLIYETKERDLSKMPTVPKEIWQNLQVGDYVQLNRTDTKSSKKYASQTKNNLKNEQIEHMGFVVGKDENGVPLIWHGSESGKAYIKKINEPITLDDQPHLGVYKVSSIVRSPAMKDIPEEDLQKIQELSYYKPLDKNKKLFVKDQSTDTQKTAASTFNQQQEKFKNLGYSQDDVLKAGQLLIGGIMSMESEGNEGSGFWYRTLVKEPAAYLIKDVAGQKKAFKGDQASRGIYQLKPEYNFKNPDGTLNTLGKKLKKLGVGLDEIFDNVENQTIAGTLILLENYKNLKRDPNYDEKTDTYSHNDKKIPASYILAKSWNSGNNWQRREKYKNFLDNYDISYSGAALKKASDSIGIKNVKGVEKDLKFINDNIDEINKERIKKAERFQEQQKRLEKENVSVQNEILKKLPKAQYDVDFTNASESTRQVVPSIIDFTNPQLIKKYESSNVNPKDYKIVKRNDGLHQFYTNSSGQKIEKLFNASGELQWTKINGQVKYKKSKLGGAIELELTPEEIEWYKSQGYNVEELD